MNDFQNLIYECYENFSKGPLEVKVSFRRLRIYSLLLLQDDKVTADNEGGLKKGTTNELW